MPKIFKRKIEFYITNVCNFNCDNCNRLNNYYFSGHERWHTFADTYKKWSEKIQFGEITILGGEPLLNPDLALWIAGLRQLWPDTKINVLTNGSRLTYWGNRGFFELLSSKKTNLQITLHNKSRKLNLISDICKYLKNPLVQHRPPPGLDWCQSYNAVKDPSWPECTNYDDFHKLPPHIKKECTEIHKIDWDSWLQDVGSIVITDEKDSNILIEIDRADQFHTAPLRYVGDSRFRVYHSDRELAHQVCMSKNCTHMMHGKIYKCHHVALLPVFMRQFDVDISEQDQALLHSYQPLTADSDSDHIANFFHDIQHSIPQCKLCPSQLYPVPSLKSGTNKPKIKKTIPIIQR